MYVVFRASSGVWGGVEGGKNQGFYASTSLLPPLPPLGGLSIHGTLAFSPSDLNLEFKCFFLVLF